MTRRKGQIYSAAIYLLLVFIIACLSACASKPEVVYVPQEVDKPVPVPCKPKPVVKPPDLLLTLPAQATLTQGMKTALAQHDYDLGYQKRLEAAVASCDE